MAKSGGFGLTGHTADLGLWVEADTLEGLFCTSAASLAEVMVRGPRDGEVSWLPINLEGADHVDLFIQTLNEVIYLLDGEQLLAVAMRISDLGHDHLQGKLGVIPVSDLHSMIHTVKAATYHGASINEVGGRWRGEALLDV